MPNLLPDWHFFRPAGRLIWFSVILIILMIPIIVGLRRPKSDKPTTWAQAMAGSVYVFGLFLLAYAIIPHEFITFCDKYLQWGKDKYVIKSTTQFPLVSAWNWPVSIDMQAVRDIAVVTIYIVFFGLNILLFVKWQDRKTKTEDEDEKPVVVGRSRFGRPLKAKA
ncbi:MAG: hypothetical protein ACXV8R_05795 [Acidimicrobiia bacterium]